MKTATLPIKNVISRSPLRLGFRRVQPIWIIRGFLLIPLTLVCFGLSPRAQATDLGSVVAGNNTADGSGVLISLTTGVNNSGFGFQALNQNTSGNYNTAAGFRALYSNTTGS